MVFSSTTFLFAFLPAVLLATWLSPLRLRRFVLLFAGIAFYAWGVQEFVLLVLGSTLLDWALALGIKHARDARQTGLARLLLVAGIVQNVGLLGYYKYAGFLTHQLDRLASALGEHGPSVLSVALPIGISFFTFEKISYLVDVWRGDVEPRRDPIDVLLFVSLFPRSIAGPIVRLREIQNDLREPRPRPELARAGAIRFAHGLAKKVLIADQVAPVADAAFAAAAAGGPTTAAAWIGALAYSMQIYFDFSGYSDMAIGIGMMLGFRLPENFNRPYSSISITDFWRRWHMTLSRWFRDYVYIPLGGNRGGEGATYRNLLIVFVLTGFWHGAAWSFVLWGLYHGMWMLIERRMGWRGLDGVRFVPLRRAGAFLIVLIGWVLFRADTLHHACDYYRAMVEPHGGMTAAVSGALTHQAIAALAIACVIVLLPGTRNGGRWLVDAAGRIPSAARFASLGLVLPLALVYAFSSTFSPFLYFRF
ncbi:MAG: rane bound O-acyl transferase family protein [Conexibacter sp.]|nr:rane bound O-acyl transferase family protein [Conexibacter sp.]